MRSPSFPNTARSRTSPAPDEKFIDKLRVQVAATIGQKDTDRIASVGCYRAIQARGKPLRLLTYSTKGANIPTSCNFKSRRLPRTERPALSLLASKRTSVFQLDPCSFAVCPSRHFGAMRNLVAARPSAV